MNRLLTLTRLLTGLPLVFTCAVSAATLQLSAPVVWLAETGGHVYGVNGRAEPLSIEGRRVTVLAKTLSGKSGLLKPSDDDSSPSRSDQRSEHAVGGIRRTLDSSGPYPGDR
ncbi:hypothetical protein ACVWZX_004472 [Deinococcus sp. UYEF24]